MGESQDKIDGDFEAFQGCAVKFLEGITECLAEGKPLIETLIGLGYAYELLISYIKAQGVLKEGTEEMIHTKMRELAKKSVAGINWPPKGRKDTLSEVVDETMGDW